MGFLLDRLLPLLKAATPRIRGPAASLDRLSFRDLADLNLPEDVHARIMEQRLRDLGMGRW